MIHGVKSAGEKKHGSDAQVFEPRVQAIGSPLASLAIAITSLSPLLSERQPSWNASVASGLGTSLTSQPLETV